MGQKFERKLHEERSENLLESFYEIVRDGSIPKNISLEVAKKSDVKQGTFFNHFKCMDDFRKESVNFFVDKLHKKNMFNSPEESDLIYFFIMGHAHLLTEEKRHYFLVKLFKPFLDKKISEEELTEKS